LTIPGVLLTGGASRRMGTDKATLVIEGETLAARAARLLAEVCAPVVEVGSGVTNLPSVREEPPGSGPLAALLAGVDKLDVGGPVLVLACDLPLVTAAALHRLARWPGVASVVPLVDGRPQYVCARWSEAALGAARAEFASGGSAMQVLASIDAEFVEGGADFVDVDTPADLGRLGLGT